VKCKTGDLSDVNNYRAIAISTSMSKLFENVLSVHVKSSDYFDAYQFGFTSGCSTSLCTGALKRTVDCYTQGGSSVQFSLVYLIPFKQLHDKIQTQIRT